MTDTLEARTARIDARAAALLLDDPDITVPLVRLHARLAAELGPAVGTPEQLRERLACQPDRFLIIDAPGPAWDTDAWSRESRELYGASLRRLGAEPGPRVALLARPAVDDAPEAGIEGTLHCLERSLLALWYASRGDAAGHADLIEAGRQARELREALTRQPWTPAPAITSLQGYARRARSTTPPRGPRSGA